MNSPLVVQAISIILQVASVDIHLSMVHAKHVLHIARHVAILDLDYAMTVAAIKAT